MESIKYRVAGLSSPRLLRLQRIVFVLVALPLAISAWDRATAPAHLSTREALFVALLAFGAAADLAMAVFYRRLSTHGSDLPDRLLFALTGVLNLADAADGMLRGARAIHLAYLAVGLINLVVAATLHRLRAYRTIQLGPEGVTIRRTRFRRLRFAWSDVVSVDTSGLELRFRLVDDEIEVRLSPDETFGPGELETTIERYRTSTASRGQSS